MLWKCLHNKIQAWSWIPNGKRPTAFIHCYFAEAIKSQHAWKDTVPKPRSTEEGRAGDMVLSKITYRASLVARMVKNLPAVQETWVWSLGWEDPLEKGMATHSSVLAWRIPWTEEPDRLQFTGSQRVRHDWATNTQGGEVAPFSRENQHELQALLRKRGERMKLNYPIDDYMLHSAPWSPRLEENFKASHLACWPSGTCCLLE